MRADRPAAAEHRSRLLRAVRHRTCPRRSTGRAAQAHSALSVGQRHAARAFDDRQWAAKDRAWRAAARRCGTPGVRQRRFGRIVDARRRRLRRTRRRLLRGARFSEVAGIASPGAADGDD